MFASSIKKSQIFRVKDNSSPEYAFSGKLNQDDEIVIEEKKWLIV